MMNSVVKAFVMGVGVLSLLAGCATMRSSQPITLKIAVNDIYCKDTACACVHHIAARTYADLQRQLEKDYDIRLELTYFNDPYYLEDAIVANKFDGVLCKPWIAMRLQQKAGADFQRVVDIMDPDENRELRGMFVVTADSALKTMNDLNGKRVVIGEVDAYEKHFAAKAMLDELSVKPSKIEQRASCIENLGMIMDGDADAAVISDYALTADCAIDFIKPEDFRVLGYTKPIPLTSIMLDRRKVSSRTLHVLQKALLSLSGSNAPASMLSSGFVKPSEWNPVELR